jgi:murein DD-endopeptidase MepM/ murein hydrolase activator NlpD
MSFVMIATGPSSRSGVRTLSLRGLLAGGALAALALLALGAGLGYWASTAVVAVAPAEGAPPTPRALMPFAVEQLGALSARLFQLESQAGQLSEHIRSMGGRVPKADASVPAKNGARGGRGGPMLPAHDAAELHLQTLQSRLAQIEQQVSQVADAATVQHLAMMRLPSRLPTDGAELSSTFGNREDPLTGRRAFHAGLDFAAAYGAPIRAAAAGTVSFAGFKPDYGWTVEIEHGNALATRYAHASRLDVKRGMLVRAGEKLASVGSSGRSTGPHLHFEVLRNGRAADPRLYLAGL